MFHEGLESFSALTASAMSFISLMMELSVSELIHSLYFINLLAVVEASKENFKIEFSSRLVGPNK